MTLASLGLSFNDLMFPLLSQVMKKKKSTSRAQDRSFTCAKINPGLLTREIVFITVLNYTMKVSILGMWMRREEMRK